MYKELSLCFTALILATAGGIPVSKQDCRRAIVTDTERLLNNLPNNRAKLFTPNNTGVKCTGVAMKCFMKETEVLEEYVENEYINDLIKMIQRNVKKCWEGLEDATEENGCSKCDSYERQTSEVFLNHMMTLLQNASH